MKIIKKALALALAGVMMLSMASCSGQSWIVKYNGEEIPVGVYTYYIYNAYQMYSYYGMVTTDTPLSEQSIPTTNDSGETETTQADTYINDYALDQVLYLAELTKRFNDAGLTLTDEELAEAESAVADEYAAYEDFYTTNGVAKSSVLYGSVSGKYGLMQEKLFHYTYGEGGPKEVTDEALKTYYTDNYVSYTYIYETTKETSGDEVVDKDVDEIKKRFEQTKAGVEAGTTDFEKIAAEYAQAYSDDYSAGKNGVAMTTTKKSESELMTELLKLNVGEIKVVELDGYVYLLQRHDISTNGYFEENEEYIFEEMNYSDFQAELMETAKSADYELNESAFKKFGVRKLDIDGVTL